MQVHYVRLLHMKSERVLHTIDPVFNAETRVLLLGSFPSPKSREVGFFYGHPQNRMWRVLATVMGEDAVPLTAEERTVFLLRNHLAMWDVIESCFIEGASDASIKDVVPNNLSRILDAAPIQVIFCTGAKAYQLYGRYQAHSTGIPVIKLPSTSGANAAWSFERLVEAYQVVAEAAVAKP